MKKKVVYVKRKKGKASKRNAKTMEAILNSPTMKAYFAAHAKAFILYGEAAKERMDFWLGLMGKKP